MKYKIKDKVKIKTWETLKKEFGLDNLEAINKDPYHFGKNRESYINKQFPDRIFEIQRIEENAYGAICYIMKDEPKWEWDNYMIEYLVKPEIFEKIESRFEILDL